MLFQKVDAAFTVMEKVEQLYGGTPFTSAKFPPSQHKEAFGTMSIETAQTLMFLHCRLKRENKACIHIYDYVYQNTHVSVSHTHAVQ